MSPLTGSNLGFITDGDTQPRHHCDLNHRYFRMGDIHVSRFESVKVALFRVMNPSTATSMSLK